MEILSQMVLLVLIYTTQNMVLYNTTLKGSKRKCNLLYMDIDPQAKLYQACILFKRFKLLCYQA